MNKHNIIAYCLFFIICIFLSWNNSNNANNKNELQLEIDELTRKNLSIIRNDSIKSIAESKYRAQIDSTFSEYEQKLKAGKVKSYILNKKYKALEKDFIHINSVLGELPDL